MFCKNCGTELPDDILYCPVCGTAVNDTDNVPYEVRKSLEPAHPMKWHKFLIYFQLFAAAIINAVNAVGYFAGFFAGNVFDILYGVLSVVLAVLAIYARFRLAGFRKNGPKMYTLFLCITCVLEILYLVFIIVSDGSDLYAVSSAVSSLFLKALTLVLTNIYYKKRADLFVN